mgnify:FL=1
MAVGVGLLWPGVGFVLRSDHISNSSPAPGPAQGESEGGRNWFWHNIEALDLN